MSGLGVLERLTTTEQVLRAVRGAIVAGTLAQGEQLREMALAETFGTGRSAVREAMRSLVQEGLVQHEPHRGAFVRIIDAEDIVDVYRAREAVECAALERAVELGAEPAPLRSAFERLRAAATGGAGTWLDMADADIHFHETLVGLSGSPRLERMFATLAAESRMHLHSYPPYPPLQNVEDHERIVVAFERGAADAVELVREHLRFSARLAVAERRDQ
jgi:DNA-binding GntR family transcriptional regulator